jgi:hypothetical protein
MTNRPRSGRVTVDWVDASVESASPGEFNLGWSLRFDPPVDDERTAALLREILDAV